LSDIFHEFLNNPEVHPLDKGAPLLLHSFEGLKSRSSDTILAIPAPSNAEWVWAELGRGDSSVVTASTDSESKLIAVKTARSEKCVPLIQREAAILKTLKHPLVLRIVDRLDNKSMIMTEFAGNGSLASHLPSEGCANQSRLIGANRIARVIIGIALAMRFVHSRRVIHRDFRPGNILLDFDWNVRIADFGHSISPNQPNPLSSNCPNAR
jgi:serine/threonine protein kinase